MSLNKEQFDDLKTRYKRAIQDDATTWVSMWKDLADYILPRHGRWQDKGRVPNTTDKQAAVKRVNGTATRAVSIAVSGLKGGLIPHALPWFKLSLWDEDMNGWSPARDWLHLCEQKIYSVLSRSNFYSAAHTLFLEQVVFGTGPMAVYEDQKSVIRCTPWTAGEYALMTDHTGRVDTAFRWYWLTARAMKQKFGEENLSETTKNLLTRQPDKMVKVINAIFPREDYREGSVRSNELPWASVHWEDSGTSDKPLLESGFHECPVMFPRWEVIGEDAYGSNSLGMEMISDIKMLQVLEKDKLAAIAQECRPPMNVPVGFKGKLSLKPNAVNYVDASQREAITRTVETRPQIGAIMEEIRSVEQRIKDGFFNDLFLVIIEQEKAGMTAYEIAKKYEEKLAILGPVLERQNSEFLGPFIDRVWDILNRNGMFTPPPPELKGKDVKIDYISLLAQAQKAIGTAPMEKTLAFVSGIAQLVPDALDKINTDAMVDEYGLLSGVNPKVIRSADDVKKIRDARQQAAEKQMAVDQAQQVASAAKNLGGTNVGDGSAMGELLKSGAPVVPELVK